MFECFGTAFHESARVWTNDFRNSTNAGRDDRQAARHGFEHYVRTALARACQAENVGSAVPYRQLLMWTCAHESHAVLKTQRPNSFFQLRAIGPFSNDDKQDLRLV